MVRSSAKPNVSNHEAHFAAASSFETPAAQAPQDEEKTQ
jgi:hypothetical protein